MDILVTATRPGTARTPHAALWPAEQLDSIRAAFPMVHLLDGVTQDPRRTAATAEVVFGHLARDVFLAAPRLRWIQSHGSGSDWVQAIPELVESDVIVTNTRGAHAATIAEHTFGLLIALARHFYRLFEAQQHRIFLRPVEPTPVGLSGLTIGIIGFGAIGRAIAQRAHAFEMDILAVDVQPLPVPEYVAHLWHIERLPDLLRQSDVVIVTAPLTEQTRGLLGATKLALMKPTAYLIGVSRGGIIDQAALVEALRGGRLAGAALDVHEPFFIPPDSDLWDAPNLIHTPHCAGESQQTTAMTTRIFCENLARYLAGQPLLNLVDKRLGY